MFVSVHSSLYSYSVALLTPVVHEKVQLEVPCFCHTPLVYFGI